MQRDTDADENPYRSTEFTNLPGKRGWASTLISIVIIVAIIAVVIALLLPAVRTAPSATRRNACNMKLKQIGIALQNYANAHGGFPPAYTVDAEGKPLHSWRTLILPYVEEGQLYKSIDLTKPWDDPVNAEAFKKEVDAYRCPGSESDRENYTSYLAIVTPRSCLRPGTSRALSEVTDGLNKTLVVIEVDLDHEVPWMSPVDADEKLVLKLGEESRLNHHAGGMHAAVADGSVQFLFADLPADQRRALISIAGGDNAVIEDLD